MNTLLVTVNGLRYDHYQYMETTRAYLGDSHPHTYATSPATRKSIPAILGADYLEGLHYPSGTSVVTHFDTAVGITPTTLLSERYGYDEGFTVFDVLDHAESVTAAGAPLYSSGAMTTSIASTLWQLYQRTTSLFSSSPKSFRRATEVIDAFTAHVHPDEEWFGWLHFMEPHHPFDPRPSQRARDRRLTQKVFSGDGDFDEEKQVRRLYRREVKTLDDALADLWAFIPDETRVVFCADHGTLLGEDFKWGQPDELRAELLHVPLATKNAPAVGDVVSLIDVPSLLLGAPYGNGTFDRVTAHATAGATTASMNAEHITRGDGVKRLYTGTPVNDERLATAHERFDPHDAWNEDDKDSDSDIPGSVSATHG